MLALGTSASSTICSLSRQLQRRRRSTVITSARCIVLEVRLPLLPEPGHPCHPTSRWPHRAVTVKVSVGIAIHLVNINFIEHYAGEAVRLWPQYLQRFRHVEPRSAAPFDNH